MKFGESKILVAQRSLCYIEDIPTYKLDYLKANETEYLGMKD
jgi:hypothetical protein